MTPDIMPSKKECDIKAIEDIVIEWTFKNRAKMRSLISEFLDQHRNDVLEEVKEAMQSEIQWQNRFRRVDDIRSSERVASNVALIRKIASALSIDLKSNTTKGE